MGYGHVPLTIKRLLITGNLYETARLITVLYFVYIFQYNTYFNRMPEQSF